MIGRLIGFVVGRMAGKSCVSGGVERARFQDEALAAAEAEIENWEPQEHAEFRDGGWWFHNEDDHRFVVLEGSGNCQQCGCPRKAEKRAAVASDAECYYCGCPAPRHDKIIGEDWACSDCDCGALVVYPEPHPVDAQHHGGYRMEVRDGNVIPIPLLPEDQVDRVEAVLEYHRELEQPQYRDGGLWCNCGTFCLNGSNHRRHQAQVIANLYAADERVAPVVRKHQQ